MRTEADEQYLLVRVAGVLCALPLPHVDETMRPLPIQSVPGAPPFVRGVSRIRGDPLPVVDAARALRGEGNLPEPTRFVVIKTANRRVALEVDSVLGVRRIEPAALSDLPPLLTTAAEEVVSAIGSLDAELLLVLRSGAWVPESFMSSVVDGDPE